MLLKHGADPNKKNRDGHTPLDLVKEGDEDVADLLRGEAALLEAAKKGKFMYKFPPIIESANGFSNHPPPYSPNGTC